MLSILLESTQHCLRGIKVIVLGYHLPLYHKQLKSECGTPQEVWVCCLCSYCGLIWYLLSSSPKEKRKINEWRAFKLETICTSLENFFKDTKKNILALTLISRYLKSIKKVFLREIITYCVLFSKVYGAISLKIDFLVFWHFISTYKLEDGEKQKLVLNERKSS